MDTSIFDFHQKFYITAIQKLALHLQHVHIIGTHNYGSLFQYSFKRSAVYHNVLCRLDCVEVVVAIFVHQIKSEY